MVAEPFSCLHRAYLLELPILSHPFTAGRSFWNFLPSHAFLCPSTKWTKTTSSVHDSEQTVSSSGAPSSGVVHTGTIENVAVLLLDVWRVSLKSKERGSGKASGSKWHAAKCYGKKMNKRLYLSCLFCARMTWQCIIGHFLDCRSNYVLHSAEKPLLMPWLRSKYMQCRSVVHMSLRHYDITACCVFRLKYS